MADLTELADRWRADLAAWAIPEHITAAVDESPWVLPRQVFARRADRLADAPSGPSYEQEWAVLDPAGSVSSAAPSRSCLALPRANSVFHRLVRASALRSGLGQKKADAFSGVNPARSLVALRAAREHLSVLP